MLYMFFWVSPRRQDCGLPTFHLQRLDVEYEVTLHTPHPAFEDGTDRGFRNVGKPQSDAGEIPKRTHTIFTFFFQQNYTHVLYPLSYYSYLYYLPLPILPLYLNSSTFLFHLLQCLQLYPFRHLVL